MKRVWISVLVLVALAGAVYFAFSGYKIEIAGFVANLRNPIRPTQQITLAAGPAEAPAGERAPNIIVIVADDLGFNDSSFNGGGFADGSETTPNTDAIGREGASDDGPVSNEIRF